MNKVPRRVLLAAAIITPKPSASAQTDADGFGVMAREKSLAANRVVLLNTFGKSNIADYARGIELYGDAKAEFDGLITQLEFELDQKRPPDTSDAFQAKLKAAVDKREAFTAFVAGLMPKSVEAPRGWLDDPFKSVTEMITALTDSGIKIWHEYRDTGADRRKILRQDLESLRWPEFSAG